MMNTVNRYFLILAVVAIFSVAFLPGPGQACVGRKLVLGALEGERPGMVSRILSILIHERTGTTVEVKYFDSEGAMEEAVTRGKVDLYVDHVDDALERLGRAVPAEPTARYVAVKKTFDEEFNLVWLKPMGFTGRDRAGQAATVVRKDALKKFPALPRLLEKIGTRVILDDATLDRLVARGRESKPARVAREYLKEVKLI